MFKPSVTSVIVQDKACENRQPSSTARYPDAVMDDAIRAAIAISRRDPRAPISVEQVFGELEACIAQVTAASPGA